MPRPGVCRGPTPGPIRPLLFLLLPGNCSKQKIEGEYHSYKDLIGIKLLGGSFVQNSLVIPITRKWLKKKGQWGIIHN